MQPRLSNTDTSFWASVQITIAIALVMTLADYSFDLLYGESPSFRPVAKEFCQFCFIVGLLRWAIPRFQYQPK